MGGPDARKPFVLERCPLCDYDVRRLPTNHTCPECGFEYDEDTIVLPCWVTKGGRESWQRRLAVLPISLLGVLLALCIGLFVPPNAVGVTFIVTIVVVALAGTFIMRRLFPKPAKHQLILTLSPSGIGVRMRMTGKGTQTPWNDISSVRLRKLGGNLHRLTLRQHRPRWIRKIPASVLFETDKADPDALKEQIDRYLAGSEPATE